MRNLFIILFLLSIYSESSSQTKVETYLYLNEKINMYKLNDLETNDNYWLRKLSLSKKSN